MAFCIEEIVTNAEYVTSKAHKHSAEEKTHRIIVIDTHSLLRLALHYVVASFPHTQTVNSLSAVQDLFGVIETLAQHIVILGPSISVSDCLALSAVVRERHIRCGIVAIQQDLQPELIHTLIEQGINGVLDEHASEQDLIQAIRAARYDKTFLSRRTRSMLSTPPTGLIDHLTGREIQVLSCLKHGETNFRIACTLGLKEKTIEKYLTAIYEKLHVHSRAEAILCLHRLHF